MQDLANLHNCSSVLRWATELTLLPPYPPSARASDVIMLLKQNNEVFLWDPFHPQPQPSRPLLSNTHTNTHTHLGIWTLYIVKKPPPPTCTLQFFAIFLSIFPLPSLTHSLAHPHPHIFDSYWHHHQQFTPEVNRHWTETNKQWGRFWTSSLSG